MAAVLVVVHNTTQRRSLDTSWTGASLCPPASNPHRTMVMRLSAAALAAALCTASATAATGGQQYPGPSDQSPAEFTAWFAEYQEWRDVTAASFDLSNYDRPDVLSWRTSFIQPQLMMHDKYLYDRSTSTWTVDRYLNDVISRYGGIDSVVGGVVVWWWAVGGG